MSQRVHVRVPATSANLGPGFDALGLALDLVDEYELTPAPSGVTVTSQGHGAGDLPADADHLVARAVLAAAREFDVALPGFSLRCRNAIPQGRGLGSSAAAIAGGVSLAAALAAEPPSSADLVALATRLEGHPDNVAPALLGGFTVAWCDTTGGRAVSLPVHPAVIPVVFVPRATSPTAAARAALPATVPHADAAFNAGRSALLVAALTRHPDLLFAATEDRLHQQQRAAGYPAAIELVAGLRRAGHAAAISGAGPTVIVLAPDETAATALLAWPDLAPGDYSARRVTVGSGATATRLAADR